MDRFSPRVYGPKVVSLPGLATVLVIVVSGLVGAPGHSVAGPGSAGPPSVGNRLASFSPNGDGVRDRVRIRYFLPEASPVAVTVFGRDGRKFRTVLGRQAAGEHIWVWDGRTPTGRRLRHDLYSVEVRTPAGADEVRVNIDLRFEAVVDVMQRFGRLRSETTRVYPASTVVRDSIGLLVRPDESGFRQAVLQVRNPEGRVMQRRDVVEHPTRFVEDGILFRDPEVWEARTPADRPLPPGRYLAVVRGVDGLGNAGTSEPFHVRVSSHRLDWVEETRSPTPVESRVGECERSDANGCGTAYCGVVSPSAIFSDGLSLRGAVCTDFLFQQSGARTYHLVTFDDAVRGIDSYRLSFSGAPTNSGETDPATLDVDVPLLTSSTGGQTPWLTEGPFLDGDAWLINGQPPLPPSIWWRMSTADEDDFDVGAFTVDVRYLVVAD